MKNTDVNTFTNIFFTNLNLYNVENITRYDFFNVQYRGLYKMI